MRNLVFRYFIFVLGLYFLSLGVVLIVLSSLGTTPISSVNYVLSLNTPLTLGTATFIINMLLIIGQFWLIRGLGGKKDIFEILLQIPFSLIFSLFIDFNMTVLSDIHLSSYCLCIGVLLTGCLSQAIGVVLELKPNVAIMSAEGFVKYASRRYNKDFGKLKVKFDISLVTMAALISVAFSGHIDGIREGTLVAALSTGYIVSFLSRYVITRKHLDRLTSLVHI